MVDALFYSLHATIGVAVHFCQHQVKFYFTDRSVAWKEFDFDIRETSVVLPIPSCVSLGRLINLSKLRFPYLYNESDKIHLI